MTKFHIGCAGWSYDDWLRSFYPKGTKSANFLRFYTKYFDIVEVNSTFYNLPANSTVHNWLHETPDDFRYIIKIWQEISHRKLKDDTEEKIYSFINRVLPLEEKISCYLLQFPPNFVYSSENLHKLKFILGNLITKKVIAVELRDNSWFKEEILDEIIDGKKVIFTTVYLNDIIPYYKENQNSYYIRLIGDRKLTKFDKIQRKMEEQNAHLLENLKKLREQPSITDIFVIFNNHYSGFAPEDSINLMKSLGLNYKDFHRQSKLDAFI